MENITNISSALNDFRRARRQADLQNVLARLGGKSQRLVSFEEIRKHVGETGVYPRGLKEIPLDAIVGSVGRYQDFTRSFLPRQESQGERWARIRAIMESSGLPPIEVYKLGDVYFVLDGHHRVSVSRQLGAKHIEAYVTEIPTRAQLSPDDDADEIILKAEQARFLKDTQLDEIVPDGEIRFTCPGCYRELREHIAVHQYYMGLEQKRDISPREAAEDWIEKVYQPVVQAIRSRELLRDFPDRTEADLYLWLMKHRSELIEGLGWEIEADEAAEDLGERFSLRPARTFKRLLRSFKDLLTPDVFESGPAPGEWRRRRDKSPESEQLFSRILVALSGEEESWLALDQAILVAQREKGKLRGLHVIPADRQETDDQLAAIRSEFERRIQAAGVTGNLVLESGQVAPSVERRARWSDLVVLHLKHPPGLRPAERLRSGMRLLIQRSPRPVLVVPQISDMQHALLAFDGSRKATEALYLSAYITQRWDIALTVFTSRESGVKADSAQADARKYLEAQGVKAEYVQRSGPTAQGLLDLATEKNCDFVLMGGYGAAPVVEVVLGSTVDQVLREFRFPVLICR